MTFRGFKEICVFLQCIIFKMHIIKPFSGGRESGNLLSLAHLPFHLLLLRQGNWNANTLNNKVTNTHKFKDWCGDQRLQVHVAFNFLKIWNGVPCNKSWNSHNFCVYLMKFSKAYRKQEYCHCLSIHRCLPLHSMRNFSDHKVAAIDPLQRDGPDRCVFSLCTALVLLVYAPVCSYWQCIWNMFSVIWAIH